MKGKVTFVALAVVLAAVFVRLGVWQVDRLHERREANAFRESRLSLPPLEIPPAAGPAADGLPWRRARIVGRYDFGREAVIRNRPHRGRPGVHVLTPLVPQEGPAVLVLRGWLPAADGLRPPLSRGRAAGEARAVTGIFQPAVPPGGETARRVPVEGEERLVLSRPDVEAAAEDLPYPTLGGVFLWATDPGPAGPLLEPLPEPELTDGPHLTYAIQWFAFAAIALVGAVAYVRKEPRESEARRRHAPRRG